MYCVLGAQAQTRWAIVGQGAKSLQTQQIFHRLVKDTILHDNPTELISDMRTAKDTNVVLNMTITPGIILIPLNMIILKDKVEGYNNVLMLATKTMKFGVNTNVNHVALTTKKPRVARATTKKPVPVCTDNKTKTCSCYSKSTGQSSPLPFGKHDRVLVTKFVL